MLKEHIQGFEIRCHCRKKGERERRGVHGPSGWTPVLSGRAPLLLRGQRSRQNQQGILTCWQDGPDCLHALIHTHTVRC